MDGSPGTAVQLTNDVGNIWGLSGSYFFGQTCRRRQRLRRLPDLLRQVA